MLQLRSFESIQKQFSAPRSLISPKLDAQIINQLPWKNHLKLKAQAETINVQWIKILRLRKFSSRIFRKESCNLSQEYSTFPSFLFSVFYTFLGLCHCKGKVTKITQHIDRQNYEQTLEQSDLLDIILTENIHACTKI